MKHPFSHPVTRIVVAALLPSAACFVQWLFWDAFQPFVWFLFYPTVFLSSRLGGMKGGLMATGLSILLVVYVFMPPQFSFVVDKPKGLYSAGVFAVMGLLFCLTHEGLRKAQERIERLYERTKELDELKSQLFANISHELRTPLTLILGPVGRQLAREDLGEEARQDLRVVERNARLLYRHVSDLLDVARLEARRMELRYSREDLAGLVRFVGSHFELLAAEKRIRFTVQAADPLMADVDTEKCQRLLLNLLSNAFKFTPDGGEVSLSLGREGERAAIEVRDTGPGIPAHLREAIFERFRQIEGGVTRHHGGTGLGLAIVKEFVELHRGTIAVGEASGGGARFTVVLPLTAPPGVTIHGHSGRVDAAIGQQVVDELRPAGKPRPLAAPPAGENAPLILVVEDNLDMNAFLVRTLGRKYRVAAAFHGQEGLEQALALRPDLIVTDIMMPGMSGDQMVRELRARAETAHVPIMVLTAKADDALRLQLLKEPVQACLSKPFSEEELLARVGGLVTERQQAEAALQRSERQFEFLAGVAPVGMFRADSAGNLLYANSLWRAFAGCPGEAGLGAGWLQGVHPEDRDRVLATWRAAVTRQESFRQEFRFETPDGIVTWVLAQAVAEKDGQGRVAGYVGAVTDITGRKRMEETLRASLDRISLAERAAGAGFWDWDVSTGQLSWSDGFYGLFGLAPTVEATFDIWLAIVHPEDRAPAMARIQQALELRAPLFNEYRIVLPGGVTRWIAATGRTEYDAESKPRRMFGICLDITEHRRAQEALRESEEQLRAILESVTESVLLIDATGKVLEVNGTAARRLGRSPGELLGRSIYEFLPPTLVESRRRQVEAACATGQPVRFEDQRGEITMEHHLYPVPGPAGPVTRIAAFGRDITARQRAEEEHRRLYDRARDDAQIRAELLEEVNHRVKNNLVSILGLIAMQKQDPALAARDPRAILASLQSRVEGMVAVHQMLTSASWAPLPLGEMVNRIVDGAIAVSPIRDRLTVRLTFQPETCRQQQVVPRQASALALILNELVANGVKHAFEGRAAGGIGIDIGLVSNENGLAMLSLGYRDDGAGWPAEVLAGTREGIGLRLIRDTLRGLPQGAWALSNDGGARACLNFVLTPPQP